MHLRVARILVIMATVLMATPMQAVMLCARKSGDVALRQTCRKKETPIDVGQLGLLGPKGDPGPDGARGPQVCEAGGTTAQDLVEIEAIKQLKARACGWSTPAVE